MFSLTLPVCDVICAPLTLVVLNIGAVFGVTLIKIVALVDKPATSVTFVKKGCANSPSPLLTVFILAVEDVFVFISPLPL